MSTNGTTTYASYSCSLNYTLRGQQHIACGSDGLWEIGMPQCGRYKSRLEHSGLVVEHQTPDLRSSGFDPHLDGHVVYFSKTH